MEGDLRTMIRVHQLEVRAVQVADSSLSWPIRSVVADPYPRMEVTELMEVVATMFLAVAEEQAEQFLSRRELLL